MKATANPKVSEVPQVQTRSAKASTQMLSSVDGVTEVSSVKIPSLIDRPHFVVFDTTYVEDGQTYRAGVWYFDVVKGKDGGDPQPRSQWVCSPLHIDAVTFDHSDNNYGRHMRFKNTLGKWRTWTMPMSMLGGDGVDVRKTLLDMGVEIDPTPSRRPLLLQYIQWRTPRRQLTCVLQTGWADSRFGAYVLPDTVIGPMSNAVTYQSDCNCHQEYSLSGTLPGWQRGIAAPAIGNPILVLALCTAFAGPMLALCNAEGGGVHLIGDSSTGKTTAIAAACSVWGGASMKRSWRTTANGLEGVATLFNDAFLALDEISECEPREVGALVYMLGNGRGKQRAGRNGQARPVASWRSSVLSTGERSIETTMAEGGYHSKAGQAVRMLDVSAQRRFGAWDELHGHESGPAFSNAIKRESLAHHGHAGREFLERLTRESKKDFSERLQAIESSILAGHVSPSGQAQRAAIRFALFALAGELATSYGITGWSGEEATKSAKICFDIWKSLRPEEERNLEHRQILDAVKNFIERHGDSRFSNITSPNENSTPLIRDRAGYWEQQQDAAPRIYFFYSDGMHEALKGFDFKRGLDALQLAGAIKTPGSDGKRSTIRRVHGVSARFYAVDPSALNPEQPAF